MRGNTTGICADGGTLEHPMTPAATGTGCVSKCPLVTARIIMSLESTGLRQRLNEWFMVTQLQPLSCNSVPGSQGLLMRGGGSTILR